MCDYLQRALLDHRGVVHISYPIEFSRDVLVQKWGMEVVKTRSCLKIHKMMGLQVDLPRREEVDLIVNNIFIIEFEKGDHMKPKCFVD